jgi:uncharacterized protein (TIGR03118 family)
MKNLRCSFSSPISTVLLGLSLLVSACGGAINTDVASDDAALSSKGAIKMVQTNLVSDQPGVAAVTDPNLLNPWGIAFNPGGGAWISDNHSGLTTVYDPTGALKLTVSIPPPGGATSLSAPTGQVINNVATDFKGDKFIFVTEDGTISGWQPAPGTVLRVDNSKLSSNYKGVALARAAHGMQIYAAAFRTGTIDVYDNAYRAVHTHGGFTDSSLPRGYAPFNIALLDDVLFVAYAKQNPEKGDDVSGAGHGYINAFDTEGNLLRRVVSKGALNSPWGLAMAPPSYGKVANTLLVGNFGDGRINAYKLPDFGGYDTSSARLVGPLGDKSGLPISIENLWALTIGPDAGGANSNQLYFTAGTGHEAHGLFGRLELAQ